MDSSNRADFLTNLKSGGKYEGIVGLYRHNISADSIGVFDKEIINALVPSVKWIAHNGAGYDQIDVQACKENGEPTKSESKLVRLAVLYSVLSYQVFSYQTPRVPLTMPPRRPRSTS